MLFFILSSFLLTTQILEWPPSQLLRAKRWLRYMEARILRILPLYLFVLAFCLVTTYLKLIPIAWRAAPLLEGVPFPMTLDSLQEHLLMKRGEDILWTIPVEFKFYLLLPLLLMMVLIPLRHRQMAAITLLASVVLVVHGLYPVGLDTGVETLPFIGVFLTGILLAFVWRRDRMPGAAGSGKAHAVYCEFLAWLCLAIYACLIPSVYLAVTGLERPIANEEGQWLYATLWALMTLFMLRGVGLMRKVLDSRPFAFLGMISFSLYLWHRLPMHLMQRLEYFHHVDFLPHWLKAWITFSTTIALAFLSYMLIERPVQQWRRRRSATRRAGAISRDASRSLSLGSRALNE